MKIFASLLAAMALVLPISAADAPTADPLVSVKQAEEQIAAGIQLLDVRTLEEWNKAHLKGATRIDVNEDGFLEKAKAQLDAQKPLLVYCRSGKRSAGAAQQLRAAGFTKVLELQGGIIAWQAADKAVEK
jgi:rhodanese-related sulfurtransferase